MRQTLGWVTERASSTSCLNRRRAAGSDETRRTDNLQGDGDVEKLVSGTVNLSHSTSIQELIDSIAVLEVVTLGELRWGTQPIPLGV